jgi:hypothetical protein
MAINPPYTQQPEVATEFKDSSTSPLDIAKINPAGQKDPRIASALNEADASTQLYEKALRDRYAQPNWFKIAGAFAKPQLGGFLASLGSASDVVGQQVEQQRAIEPTIYRMRSEIAAKKVGLTQKSVADEMLEKWRKTNPGKPYPPQLVAEVEQLAPGSSQASSAKTSLEATSKTISNVKEAINAENSNPMIDTQRLVYGGEAATTEEIAERKNKIISMRPPQIDEADWSVMPIEQKMARQAQYGKDQATMGMDETQKSSLLAKTAFDTLPLLHSIRDLALGTGIKNGQEDMAKALNYFGGNSPFDAIARAAADGKIINGKLEGFDNYARQMNMSPEIRDNFQKLVKLLSDYQVRSINAAQNPTDAYSALKQQGSPNIGNSQKSLVTLTDLLGHAEKHSLDRYTQTMNVPALKRIEALKPLEQAYGEEHAKIAISDPLKYTPSWYNPSSPSPVAPPTRTSASTTTTSTTANPTGTITREQINDARKALETNKAKP